MKPSRAWLVLVLILLVGAGLRIHALGQDRRFHPDEAWFTTFARNAALNGDWMLHGALDKTPLSIYASALSMTLFTAHVDERGLLDFTVYQGEFAARLPNIFAGILLIAAVYALAQALYRDRRISLLAAAMTALSPFAIAFSATAFTDTLMLLLMTMGVWMAVSGRWTWSGFWLVLAVAAKQQAVFYVPLAIALGWAMRRVIVADIFRLVITFMLGLGALLLWDRSRAETTSLWMLAYLNNAGMRPIRSDELLPRLISWLEDGRHLLGAPTPLFGVIIPLAVLRRTFTQHRQRSSLIDIVLLVFTLIYLLLHWLMAFNTYDRYLLPLLPPFVLLSARASLWLWNVLRRYISKPEVSLLGAAVGLALFVSATEASEQPLPSTNANSSFVSYEGIDALAEFLNAQSLGAIIYDHWLNWELGYYMGQWSDKRRVYYPLSDALVADALLQPDPAPRYFPVPADASVSPWLEALSDAGFEITTVYETPQWKVYRLIPPFSGA